MIEKDDFSSSPEGKTATVRGGYYRKTSCSFCCSSVFLRGEDTPQENEMRNLLLKTLCLQMAPTNHKIPSQCSRSSFSLCESCLRLVEALLKIQNEVDALFKVRDKVLEAIRVKTEEGINPDHLIHDNEELTPTTPLGYQIRKMILAVSQCQSDSSRAVFENTSESGGHPINLQTEAKSIEDESLGDVSVDSTSSEVSQVSTSLSKETIILETATGISGGGNDENLEESLADGDHHDLERIIERLEANGVKIHVNGGDLDGSNCVAAVNRKSTLLSNPKTPDAEDSQDKSQPPSQELETNDDLFEILLEKSKILVDGVKLSLCTGFQGNDKNSKNKERARSPLSTSKEDDVSSYSLEKTKIHVRDEHKKRAKSKKSPSTCNSNLSTENPHGIDPSLPIYNPIIRIPKFDAAFLKRKEPKNLQKSARELEDALLMPPPPPPKRKRTIPTGGKPAKEKNKETSNNVEKDEI